MVNTTEQKQSSLQIIASNLACKASWAPLLVLTLHAILARFFGHEPVVDPIMHFLGGAAISWFVWQSSFVVGTLLGKPNRVCIELLMFSVTCAAALFWEFGEFFSDVFLGTNVQRGLGNTMRDLLLGVSGAILVVMVNRVLKK